MTGRQIPREDRPMDAIDRWWQRNVDPLVARLRREYPHLFPDAADAADVARATDEGYTWCAGGRSPRSSGNVSSVGPSRLQCDNPKAQAGKA